MLLAWHRTRNQSHPTRDRRSLWTIGRCATSRCPMRSIRFGNSLRLQSGPPPISVSHSSTATPAPRQYASNSPPIPSLSRRSVTSSGLISTRPVMPWSCASTRRAGPRPWSVPGQGDCIQMGLGSRPIGRHRWSLSQPAARRLWAMPTFRGRSCRRRLWAMRLGWPCCGRGIPRGSGTGATAFPFRSTRASFIPSTAGPAWGGKPLTMAGKVVRSLHSQERNRIQARLPGADRRSCTERCGRIPGKGAVACPRFPGSLRHPQCLDGRGPRLARPPGTSGQGRAVRRPGGRCRGAGGDQGAGQARRVGCRTRGNSTERARLCSLLK